MEISDNTFENNRGIESCISINLNANIAASLSYTKIKNNLFQGNEGAVIILLEDIHKAHLQL